MFKSWFKEKASYGCEWNLQWHHFMRLRQRSTHTPPPFTVVKAGGELAHCRIWALLLHRLLGHTPLLKGHFRLVSQCSGTLALSGGNSVPKKGHNPHSLTCSEIPLFWLFHFLCTEQENIWLSLEQQCDTLSIHSWCNKWMLLVLWCCVSCQRSHRSEAKMTAATHRVFHSVKAVSLYGFLITLISPSCWLRHMANHMPTTG